MLLRRLWVRDFGPFRGEHEFLLAPAEQGATARPVILFGGKNGSGKTSILKAVKLCLFGAGAIAERPASEAYLRYLEQSLHRGVGEADAAREAVVALEFDHVVLGRSERYCIRRQWALTPEGVGEQVHVARGGAELDDLDPDQWQQFVEGLVPPGIADLFFFDGEAIQQLTTQEVVSGPLLRAVENLLGVTLVDRLRADLLAYERHHLLRGMDRERRQEMAALERRQGELHERQTRLRQDIAQTRSEMLHLEDKIETAQDTLLREGGLAPNENQRLRMRRDELRTELGALEERARELCAGVLPVSCSPQLAQELVSQLKEERNLLVAKYSKEALRQIVPQLAARLLPRMRPQDEDKSYRDEVEALARDLLAHTDGILTAHTVADGARSVHDLSDRDGEQVAESVGRALSAASHAGELADELDRILGELDGIERRLSRVPEEAHLQELLEPLVRLREEHAALSRRLGEQETEARAAEAELAELNKQLDRLSDSAQAAALLDRKRALASGLSTALEAYRAELTASKVSALNETIAANFRLLSRKQDRSAAVVRQGRELEIRSLDAEGRVVPHDSLSAGERQILAIAFLWSLAESSSRQLPIIIDTPLARLDSDHRQNLLEHYFPHASHQMIVLSTDTEVDRQLATELAPLVSRAYRLDYHEREGATTVIPGYFWESPPHP